MTFNNDVLLHLDLIHIQHPHVTVFIKDVGRMEDGFRPLTGMIWNQNSSETTFSTFLPLFFFTLTCDSSFFDFILVGLLVRAQTL